MLPNVLPVILVFGGMGLLGMKVDIGSMMTASVAMGIAVDDTIHFLNWYRDALRQGLDRTNAIRETYRRVAKAMLQTTLIAGFGLSAFAFSTFTPTQRFGVMMLILLAVALIGDLVLFRPCWPVHWVERSAVPAKSPMAGQASKWFRGKTERLNHQLRRQQVLPPTALGKQTQKARRGAAIRRKPRSPLRIFQNPSIQSAKTPDAGD